MSETQEDQKPPKKNKAKGPIRFEAVVPITLIISGLIAYRILLFDAHLKFALETMGYYIHGAEVNIARLDTSFGNASVEIDGIEVTNAEEPTTNLLSVETVRFSALWDGLLRGKVVINEMSVDGIRTGSKRRRPGKVKPPTPPSEDDGALGIMAQDLANQAGSEVSTELQKRYDGQSLGRIAAIAGGANPASQLDEIEAKLKSERNIENLKKSLNERQQSWSKRISELPGQQQVNGLESQFKSIKTSDFKNPGELKKSVDALNALRSKADGYLKSITSTSGDFNSDMAKYSSSMGQIDDWINEDIRALEQQLNIPSVDAGELSKDLMMKHVNSYIDPYKKYLAMAQEYMPPNLSNAEQKDELLSPIERQEGRDYRFGRPNSYPLFWAKRIQISSKADNSTLFANITGRIENLTTEQHLIDSNTVISVAGDAPAKGIKGIDFQARVDRLSQEAQDTFQLKVASFPVSGSSLTDTDEVKLSMKEAIGSLKMKGIYKQKRLNMRLVNQLRNVTYDVEAKNPEVQSIVAGAMADLKTVSVEAKAAGPLLGLNWAITSPIGKQLERAFQAQLQKKLNEAREKVRAYVNERVEAEKQKLQKQADEFKAKINGQIEQAKKQVADQKEKVQSQIAQAKGEADAKVKAAEAEAKRKAKAAADAEKRKAKAKADAEKRKAKAAADKAKREAERKKKAEEAKAKKEAEKKVNKELDKLKKGLGF